MVNRSNTARERRREKVHLDFLIILIERYILLLIQILINSLRDLSGFVLIHETNVQILIKYITERC